MIAASPGCQRYRLQRSTLEPFETIYEASRPRDKRPEDKAEQLRVTFQATDAPLRAVLGHLSREFQVSIIAGQNLDGQLISLDLSDVSLSQALSLIGRRLGVEVVSEGRLYFLGDLKPEDRGLLVRRIRRLDDSQITTAVTSLLSGDGRAMASVDGLVIVADREPVLRRVHELIETIENVETVTWVVQLYLTRGVVDRIRDAGIDVLPAAELGVTLATAAEGVPEFVLPQAGSRVDASMSALLRAEFMDSAGRGMASPVIVVGDGEESQIRDGRTIPIVLRTASPNTGTVTSEVELIKVGTTIAVKCREIGDDRGRLLVDLELSEVEQIVEGVPYTREASGTFAADVVSGQIYLLGRLEALEGSTSRRRWLAMGFTERESKRDLEIWARVFRVGALERVPDNESVEHWSGCSSGESGNVASVSPVIGPASDLDGVRIVRDDGIEHVAGGAEQGRPQHRGGSRLSEVGDGVDSVSDSPGGSGTTAGGDSGESVAGHEFVEPSGELHGLPDGGVHEVASGVGGEAGAVEGRRSGSLPEPPRIRGGGPESSAGSDQPGGSASGSEGGRRKSPGLKELFGQSTKRRGKAVE
jgi:hypothetical protein